MTRILATLLAVVSLASGAAQAQIEINVGPPSGFIATTSPVYFEGHAAYWYGDRWQYREGGRWHGYREEPAYLREYRGRRAPERRSYEGGHRAIARRR